MADTNTLSVLSSLLIEDVDRDIDNTRAIFCGAHPFAGMIFDNYTGDVKMDPAVNDQFFVPVQTGNHTGVSSGIQTTALETGTATYKRYTVPIKYTTVGSQITHATLLTKPDVGSVVDLVEEIHRVEMIAFKNELGRMFVRDGRGILARVTTGASSITQAVENTQYLYEGRAVMVGTIAQLTGGTATETTVSSMNSDTSVTFADSVTTTTSPQTYVFALNAYKSSTWTEIMGLRGLLQSTAESSEDYYWSSIQGITRATNAFVNSNVRFGNSGTAEEFSEFNLANLAMNINRQGGKVDLGLTTQRLNNKLASNLVTLKRLDVTAGGKPITLPGGWTGIEYSVGMNVHLPVFVDYGIWSQLPFGADASDNGEFYGLDTSSFGFKMLGEKFGYMLADSQGSIFTQAVNSDGKKLPAWDTFRYVYGNLFMRVPKKNFVMRLQKNVA